MRQNTSMLSPGGVKSFLKAQFQADEGDYLRLVVSGCDHCTFAVLCDRKPVDKCYTTTHSSEVLHSHERVYTQK